LVFKFAFLVCSKHQFDPPPLPPSGHEVQLQSSSCIPTGSPNFFFISQLFIPLKFTLLAAAAASPMHLQLVVSTDGCRRIIPFPNHKKGVTVGSVWTGLQTRSRLVTVAINNSPPPEEQPDADGDDIFCLGSDTDEDEF
jgi:hypothetical protein